MRKALLLPVIVFGLCYCSPAQVKQYVIDHPPKDTPGETPVTIIGTPITSVKR